MTTTTTPAPSRHRPTSLTVFAAAFIAGAAAAVGVNRVLDVQLAQRKPQVECEPIFVALRSLPQGTPVTVWDVALKDWPKAMLPTTALRASDSFEGCVLRHPVREGQPILTVQLARAESRHGGAATMASESFVAPVPAAAVSERQVTAQPTTPQADLWTPGETADATPARADTAEPRDDGSPSTDAVAADEPAAAELARAEPDAAAETVAEQEQVAEQITPAQPSAPVTAQAPDDATTAEADPAPTPAAPTLASQLPVPPSPVDIDPPPAARPTLAAGPKAAPTTSEAVATDVSTMPSVMTRGGNADPAATPQATQGGRYLVVPERIALQADTSFTTPRPQPPGPPTAVPPPSVRQATKPAPTPRMRSQQPAAQAQGQGRRNGVQQGQPPARAQQRPSVPQASGQQQTPAAAQPRWGGLFPNVSAGIDAVGASWQRMRSSESQADDAAQDY